MTSASGVCVRCGEDEATHLGFTRPATCGTFEARERETWIPIVPAEEYLVVRNYGPGKPCDRCTNGSFTDSNGIVRRCWFCNGTGVVKA